MKVLLSALACEPGRGSELEVGYRAMLAAARKHDVWVLTNADTVPALAAAIAGSEAVTRIHLEGIEFGMDERTFTRLTVPGFHWYYDRWQRRAAARALELERQIGFDLVHHVTLASYWTRAGVSVVDKPLVWGPVGGGVEAPWQLAPELGIRGLGEDIGRIMIRRVLGRLGPARIPQRKAVVTFAQNTATAARLSTRGDIVILSNATALDLDKVAVSSPRTKDVYLVGRLAAWKAPTLAVRAMQYVTDDECLLHVCGDGPERRRLERIAGRWGVRERISFDGWLSRDDLLRRIATAGALVHPALHEEAGLCVGEALAMGTPVICLDRGGPASILQEWPDTPATAVKPDDARTTARALAAAVDAFLAHPPDVLRVPRSPRRSFQDELLDAYERAVHAPHRPPHRLHPVVWGFPRGKPQLFANAARTVGSGISLYAFGRRIPKLAQAAAVGQMSVPGMRHLLAQRQERPEAACGWGVWDEILERVQNVSDPVPSRWLYFRSQWAKRRSSALALDAQGTPLMFVLIEPRDSISVHPRTSMSSFRVPACLESFEHAGWHVRVIEPLPRYHRAGGWDQQRVRQIVRDIPSSLAGLIPRPAGTPGHWRPVHGDFVPWNLRQSRDGQLWLVDWEDAAWGPPLADAVRYLVAYQSLRRADSAVTAQATERMFGGAADLSEIATFWLHHRNFLPSGSNQAARRGKARDAVRGARETGAFRILAGGTPASVA